MGREELTSLLAAMRDSMTHRGPDGNGLKIAGQGRIGLAHLRLAIVDLSESAAQPMSNEDGRVIVTYNGEIYNHADLRLELEAAGHRFRSDHSDTEVIVHGFEQWGIEGLLERLDGMFAFAIWDEKLKKLTLARDRVGIKPVYFTRAGGHFRFASEIKAILSDPAFPREIEPAAVNHYLSYMIAPAPLTMFRDIYKLPPGHFMEVDAAARMRAKRYWNAVPGQAINQDAVNGMNDTEKEKFYVDGIRQRLESAVEKRMISDVPFGAFLSGGIDSSANVALMSKYLDNPVNTFTVGFKDHPHLNEMDYAKRAAKLFNTNHHEVLIDETDMTGYLDDLVHHQDEPIADWVCIPLYFVSKLAKEAGVTVVQVGEGSDEQFAGYKNYIQHLQLGRYFWKPYTRMVPGGLRRAIADISVAAARRNRAFERPADILLRAARDQELFWSASHAYWNVLKEQMVRPGAFAGDHDRADLIETGLGGDWIDSADSAAVVDAFMDPFDAGHPGADDLTRMIHKEFRVRLPELLLARVDKITMSTSVEGRVPFLDHRLVEFTMDIPQAWKLKGGEPKYLLKQAMKDLLPDDILYRKKMGFGAPMEQWLLGDFGRQAESTILGSAMMERDYFDPAVITSMFREHREAKRNNSLYLWTLFNLVAWHDHWIA